MTPEEQKTIDRLVKAIHTAYSSPWSLFWRGLLVGLARGLGATIILAIVLGILYYFLSATGLLNSFGDIIESLNQAVNSFPGR